MSIETQVLDNFLPTEVADFLESMFLGVDFPWYFTPDVTYGVDASKNVQNPAMSHILYKDETGPSSFFIHTCNIPFLGTVKLPPSRMSRAVSFLQMPNGSPQNTLHNHKHVDKEGVPHIVLLYYVCDSDGDTFMFSKDSKDEVISKQVTPKKNRALIFDGAIYHASSRPKHSRRCIINFNLDPFN